MLSGILSSVHDAHALPLHDLIAFARLLSVADSFRDRCIY